MIEWFRSNSRSRVRRTGLLFPALIGGGVLVLAGASWKDLMGSKKLAGKFVLIEAEGEEFRLHNLPNEIPYLSAEAEDAKKEGVKWDRLYEAMRQLIEEKPEFKYAQQYRLFVKKWPLHEQVRRIIVNEETAEWGEAERLCREILKIDPAEPTAHYHLGFILRRMQRYEESEQAYLTAIGFMPDYGNFYSNLGRTYEAWERNDRAIEAWSKALELMPGDPTSLEALERLGVYVSVYSDPKRPETKAYMKKEDFEKALQAKYEEYEDNPERLKEWARALLEDHSFHMALKGLNRAASLKPDDPDTWLYIAAAHHQLEQYEEGLRAVDRLLALDPKSGYGHTHKAKLLAGRGDDEQARAVLLQALELDPNQDNALQWYYLMLKEAGKEPEGRAFLEGLAERHPEAYQPYAVLASFYEDTDIKLSTGWLREAHRRAPDNIEIAAHYAGILGNSGQPGEAASVLEAFTSRFAEDWKMAWNLGQAYFYSGQTKKAIDFYREVISDGEVLPDVRVSMQEQIATWQGRVALEENYIRPYIYLYSPGGDMVSLAGVQVRVPYERHIVFPVEGVTQPIELRLLQGEGPTPEENRLLKRVLLAEQPVEGEVRVSFKVDRNGEFDLAVSDRSGRSLALADKTFEIKR